MPTRGYPDYSFPIMRVGMTTFHREEFQDYYNFPSLLHDHLMQLYPVPKTLEKLYDGSKRPKFMIWYIGKGEHWKTANEEVKKDCAVWKGNYAVWYVPGHAPGNKAFYLVKIGRCVGGKVEYVDMPKVMKVDDFWYGPEMADISEALKGKGKRDGYDGYVL